MEVVATVVGIAAIALLGAVTWLVVHLLGQNGRVLLRIDAIEAALEAGAQAPAAAQGLVAAAPTAAPAAPAPPPPGLPVGTPAPSFKLEGMYGETMTLDAPGPGQTANAAIHRPRLRPLQCAAS